MKNEEILKKSKNKVIVGEMEQQKINGANWIALICAGLLAVVFMIVEGVLGHYCGLFAIAAVCHCWASVLYFLQFFKAKRPKGVLIGAILYVLGAVAMIALYAVAYIQAW